MTPRPSRALPVWLAASLELFLLALVRERGERRAGRREGEWVRRLPSGRLLSRVTYRAGHKHGPAARWYLDGSRRSVGE